MRPSGEAHDHRNPYSKHIDKGRISEAAEIGSKSLPALVLGS